MKWLSLVICSLAAMLLIGADKPGPNAKALAREESAIAALRRLDADLTFQGKGRVRGVFFPKETRDDALAYLAGFAELKVLHLRHTKITDAGLRRLKGLKELRYLYLVGAPVTDAGLVHLQGLSSLQELRLDSTQVTDAGLEHLKGLKNLTRLDLRNTQVTDEAVSKFRQARPKCTLKK